MIMIRFLLFLTFILLSVSQIAARELILVKNHRATAEIIVAASSAPPEKYAAEQLQYWIREISSATLPLLSAPSDQKNVKIYLGSQFATTFKKELEELKDSDGYAFCYHDNNIHIFGSTPKGTLNGAFRFIEKNSDLIWARPLYTVFSKQADLKADGLGILDRPVSTERGWHKTMTAQQETDRLWMVRNNNTFMHFDNGFKTEFGMKKEIGGHNFSRIINGDKYSKSHPELFPVLQGIRTVKLRSTCLCISASPLPDIYFKELCLYVEKNMPMDLLKIGVDDSWDWCECESCNAPFKLPDGQVISKDDPGYRSTRWYAFMNPIAERVYEKYQLPTMVYTYIYLAVPPHIKISDHIVLLYCPPRQNMKLTYEKSPMDKTRNNSATILKKFTQLGKTIRIREYYGCNGSFPRPDEYVAQQDIRFAIQNGVREFTCEHPVDRRDERFDPMPSEHWDAAAITVWTINRLWWNPEQDIEELRNYFLTRTYREAAPAMKQYYSLIYEQWLARKDVISNYLASLKGSMKSHIIDTGMEGKARSYLEKAEKAAKHPVSLELVKLARANFEKGCNLDKRIIGKKVSEYPTINLPDWNRTSEVSEFAVYQHKNMPSPLATSVKILHDDKNIFFKVVCQEEMRQEATSFKTINKYLNGEFFTIHLSSTNRQGYFVFGFNRNGSYFAMRNMKLFPDSGMTVTTELATNQYTALVSIPLAAIKYEPGKDLMKRIYGVFHRRFQHQDGFISVVNDDLPLNTQRFMKDIYLED